MPKPLQHKPLWTLLSRLPIYASLQSTVALTKKLSPLVNTHLAGNLPTTSDGKEPSEIIKSISVEDQSLILACATAGVATRLKHTQSSLLEQLNRAISADTELTQLCSNHPIKRLKITVSSGFSQNLESHLTAAQLPSQMVERPTSSATVELINSMSKSLPSEELAKSLQTLAATLKANSKE